MKKLLRFLDEKILKFGVAFAIAFIALYPKLPSIHINHTWVYIRLEDFVLGALFIFWLIQLLRKKVSLAFPVGIPIIGYWVIGFFSLVFSLLFIGHHLANFFPSIAALEYFRRIEYMVLFFIAASTIKSEDDIKDYLKILFITVTGVVLYGIGQRWYILLWNIFPHFFEKLPFCFPSFQTGNEEFAKGLPLCLPIDARITSTFGGHYDLAAFLVVIIPVLFAGLLTFKNIFVKAYIFLLTVGSIILLILTASRISFVAYLVGGTLMFIFLKKKKFILPFIVVSIALLLLFSASTAKRFLETVRLASVVTNAQGQVVGVTTSSLPTDLQKKISKNPIIVEAPPPSQNLPTGSSFITLPQAAPPTTTNVAVVKSSISQDKVNQLKLANGGLEISTISGTFLVKKALVYDISFTTRFQGEWPNAWQAFMRNPLLGSGYSSITLASDSDYFRTLGETGVLGFVSLAIVFMFFGILLKVTSPFMPQGASRNVSYALAGGTIGLFLNASFIDVLEASKVAEPLWLFLGIGVGGVLLWQKKSPNYLKHLKTIFTSKTLIAIYLLIILGIVFFGSLSNFFVADDFIWLKWAAQSTTKDILGYFTNAQGFFYRPLDKLLIFFIFTFSAFKPEGFHLVMLLMHALVALGVYSLALVLFKRKLPAFLSALLFLVLPGHGENTYWISSMSPTLSTLFIIFGVLQWIGFRKTGSTLRYIWSIILGICALLSYEMSVVFPLLFALTDLFYSKPKKEKKRVIEYIPFVILLALYFFIRKATNTVALGGDYSYNLVRFIPNFFGNIFGYIGLFFTGEYFLPLYTVLRENMRMHWVFVFIVCIIVVVVVAYTALKKKKVFVHLLKIENEWYIVYGFLFGIVGLLPFVGLGNISERYLYLASIGFCISFVGGIFVLANELRSKFRMNILPFATIGLVLLSVYYGILSKNESKQWEKAGEITKNTLSILRNSYQDISIESKIFFINVPIKERNAWVFPVGLTESLWFIYRDSGITVYQMKTIQGAKDLIHMRGGPSYIFAFDKKGNLGLIIY